MKVVTKRQMLRSIPAYLLIISMIFAVMSKLPAPVVHAATIIPIYKAELIPSVKDNTDDKKKYLAGTSVAVNYVKDISGVVVFDTDANYEHLDCLSFQWQYSNDQTTWNTIDGATEYKYTPDVSLDGKYLRCCIAGNHDKNYDGLVFVDGEFCEAKDYGENSEDILGTLVVAPTITANNFDISREDVKKVLEGDDSILKNAAGVKATAIDDVPITDIKVSDKSALKAEEETYDITFSYNIVTVTVKATVRGKDLIFEKTNPQDKDELLYPDKTAPASGALIINNVPVNQYTISSDGNTLTISKDYLKTLDVTTYPAVITYLDGFKQNFDITILSYDEDKTVKSPPLFSMYKEIVLKKKNTFTINLSGITDYAEVKSDITGTGAKAKKVITIKQKANGDVLITPKKTGKSQVTCTIIQNGAEYKVVVDIKVLKQYKGTSKNYDLKSNALVSTSGELPEFNVYKRIVKGKNTKIKFTNVEEDAVVKFYTASAKESKMLKIGTTQISGKTAICTVKGKKKGWVHLTAEITQNGKNYYTRLLIRIDNGKWTKKQLKKYLK